MMTIFLGIDIGTTAIKFKVYDTMEAKINFSLPVMTYYEENAVYQNPKEILESVKEGIKIVIQQVNTINKIAFSTAMHTIIPRVNQNEELRMYIWSDNQVSEVVKEFKQTKLAEPFYYKTGTPIHAMTPFSKIIFFKQSQPDFFQKISHWQDLKSYIFSELTGNNVTDYSNASATGIFDSLNFEWDKEILAYLELKKESLPRCLSPKESFKILGYQAEELEISPEVEIILGASDGCLAALAAYKKTGGKLTLTLGTSGAIRKLTKQRELNFKSNQFCYYVSENLWVIGGATNNGGKVLEWLQYSFYDNQVDTYSSLAKSLTNMDYKKKIPVFLPYLQGERAPIWNSEATGELVELSINNTQSDIILSVAEGILFNLKKIYDTLEFKQKEKTLLLSGGFFKTPELIQAVADIFNMNACLSETTEPIDGLFFLSCDGQLVNEDKLLVVPTLNHQKQQYYEKRYELFINYLEKML